MAVYFLFSILFSISLRFSMAQECSLPSNEELRTLLNASLVNMESVDPTELSSLTITNTSYTCLAAGMMIHTYRHFSVVLEYNKNSTDSLEYVHMDGTCDGDDQYWIVDELDVDADKGYLEISLREDCAGCYGDSINDYHCFPGEYI